MGCASSHVQTGMVTQASAEAEPRDLDELWKSVLKWDDTSKGNRHHIVWLYACGWRSSPKEYHDTDDGSTR